MTQPLCRYCGRKIAKYTRSHQWHGMEGDPVTKDNVKRLVNEQILSYRYGVSGGGSYGIMKDGTRIPSLPAGTRYIRSITTWDGATYMDPYFCNGDHAKQFGRLMAKEGYSTQSYVEAVKKGK